MFFIPYELRSGLTINLFLDKGPPFRKLCFRSVCKALPLQNCRLAIFKLCAVDLLPPCLIPGKSKRLGIWSDKRHLRRLLSEELTLPLSSRQGACGGAAGSRRRPVHSRGLLA